jgi:sulfoxide reductase heme-binding subunit YedZ
MPTARRGPPYPWLKPALFTGALAPLAAIVVRAGTGALGADPIAEALNRLGLVALVFLVASLACTPLKTILGWTWPMRIRRELGLLSFFYALLHVSLYAGIDQALDLRAIFADVTKRRFIFFGFAAFALLVPLAVTSTHDAVRRLGFVVWKRIHRLAYPAACLASVHFIYRVKKDLREPLIYAAVLGALMMVRGFSALRSRGGGGAGGARARVIPPVDVVGSARGARGL